MADDPLAKLRDIHLPEAISWWPPAIGWWLLIVIIIGAITTIAYWVIRRRKQRQYRREAIGLLDKHYQQWLMSNNNVHFFNMINHLLKRTALTAFPHSRAKTLHGQQWLHFLNSKCQSKPFSKAIIKEFSQCQYQRNINIDIEQFYRSSRQWINHHADV